MGHGKVTRLMGPLRALGCVDALLFAADQFEPDYAAAARRAGRSAGVADHPTEQAARSAARSAAAAGKDSIDARFNSTVLVEATVASIIANMPWIRKVVVVTPTKASFGRLEARFGTRVELVSHAELIEAVCDALALIAPDAVASLAAKTASAVTRLADSPLPLFNTQLLAAFGAYVPDLAPLSLVFRPGMLVAKPSGLSPWWSPRFGLRLDVEPHLIVDDATLENAVLSAKMRSSPERSIWHVSDEHVLNSEWVSMYHTRELLRDRAIVGALADAVPAAAAEAHAALVAQMRSAGSRHRSHFHTEALYGGRSLLAPPSHTPMLVVRPLAQHLIESTGTVADYLIRSLLAHPFPVGEQIHWRMFYTYGVLAAFSRDGLGPGAVGARTVRDELSTLLLAEPRLSRSWTTGAWAPSADGHDMSLATTLSTVNAYTALPYAALGRPSRAITRKDVERAAASASYGATPVDVLLDVDGLPELVSAAASWWREIGRDAVLREPLATAKPLALQQMPASSKEAAATTLNALLAAVASPNYVAAHLRHQHTLETQPPSDPHPLFVTLNIGHHGWRSAYHPLAPTDLAVAFCKQVGFLL
ncbi:uncharacterized protein AMSG_01045 [Thecamonas trahens ATCC 50062]|uniref:Uncharacterized protein n=1 Tax=Thecamonas trahens ATCC 50062 TaxID=461836 RepID=A0A0L0DIU1_THETB|nr:hypothetical protein AMSG_01045 [Thecamonas trahens ATCC 50062]KNC52217.1 hypothetical protein AMSG_01045 [Thecamonas trahens ATCC 50062]|eukprot:XP_013762220.1 hypothetical protein AMSG_01045 [Thecamonas trahens ATCC 50062]